MEQCFKCGISEDKAILFDVISPSGIKQICRKCSVIENLPMIRKIAENEAETKRPERQRISTDSFVKFPRKDDIALRSLVETNFRKDMTEDFDLKKSLVENFNWIIMRARRSKKLTLTQLAAAIKEPEIALKTLEEGRVPLKSRELITKIENYLFINIKNRQTPEAKTPSTLNLGSPFNLKISDLKEMKSPDETNASGNESHSISDDSDWKSI